LTRDGEAHYGGFYLRNVDEFNLSHEDCMDYDTKYNRTMEKMEAINKKCLRRFFDYSRPSLRKISAKNESNLMTELRSFFFQGNKLQPLLKKDFTPQTSILAGIEFSETGDVRIQVSFQKGSSIFEKVNELFLSQGLFDGNKEILDDISLIIGGTIMQHPHADHQRFMSCFLDPKKERKFKKHIENVNKGKETQFDLDVGFELNRKIYNDVVSGKYGYSSILIGLSDDGSGFPLAVPLCYASSNGIYATIKHGVKEETFRVHSKSTYTSKQNNGEFEMITIHIPFGCQFAGDFVHAGANNMYMLKDMELHETLEKLTELNKIAIKKTKKPKDYSNFFEKANTIEKLSKFSRFFCKTVPKNNPIKLQDFNVFMFINDECDYADDETPFQLVATERGMNIKDKGIKEKVAKVKVTKVKETKVNEERLKETRKKYAETQKRCRAQKASMLTYSNGAYAAKANAFEVYFGINKYLDSLKDIKIEAFPQLFETLSKKVHKSVFVCQACVIIGVNKCQKDALIGKKHYWTLDFRFFEWFPSCAMNEVKLVKWLIIKESTITRTKKLTVGVFANRKFIGNEVIGLFYGQRIEMFVKTSEYAFRSKYGIYDPLRGFVGDGANVYNMAMHIVVDPKDETKVNAELSCDFLVRATRDIDDGEEIFLTRNHEGSFHNNFTIPITSGGACSV
jgi:hypothetical protein